MKIIVLLNKIANGEEVPKKIKWEDTIFAYSDYDKDYLEFPFSEEEYRGLFCMKDSILTQYLNEEIEIIEEQENILTISEEQFLFNQLNYEDTMEIIELMNKKIYKKEQEDKKIEKIEGIYAVDHRWQSENNNIFIKKINELIDEVNKLKGDKDANR